MTSDTAAPGARQVVDFETALARISMDRVLRRDPANRYHKMSPRELQALSPAWDWSRYFSETGAPPVSSVNVRSPEFFKGLNELLARTPMDSWKTYLKWHLVRANAPFLPAAFVAESFNFFGKTLTGAPENRPRWKRCVAATDAYLGEALGKVYVRQTFGAEGKERMLKMVDAIDKAMRRDLDTLPWMSDATKKQALAKLSSIVNKIGYPDRWRDYSTLEIRRGDALGNSQRGDTFAFRRDLAKIGRPFDITEWSMTPPTVNAYAGAMNTINFPAGILQPPFFDRALDDAVNYGAIGAVIGHELTHHFDDQGRKFDANGNLNDWWTSDDAKKFEEGATCFANQYSQYVAVGDVKLNGRLTLGENTADNGGLRLAHMALMESLGGTPPAPIDGFTAEQRLFLGWGQIWCQNQRPEEARRRATVDSHSSGRYRVNGVVSNMPEFQQAFGCRADAPMVRKTMCRVW
jgi:endothelin-converting enzyme/putative endopeptidase